MTQRNGRTRSKRHRPDVDRKALRHFVYRVHDANDQVIYVGRSVDVYARLRAHISDEKPWLVEARRVSMFGPLTHDAAVRAERHEIGLLQPRGNIALTARDHRPAVAWKSERVS